MTTSLGDKIRTLRKGKGYTLEKLAKLTASSKSYIWQLENKSPPWPSAEKISKIAGVLGVTPEFLINENIGEEAEADAIDEAFFRKYRRMPDKTKKKIRKIIEVWSEEG